MYYLKINDKKYFVIELLKNLETKQKMLIYLKKSASSIESHYGVVCESVHLRHIFKVIKFTNTRDV